jgi:hypothetical protein
MAVDHKRRLPVNRGRARGILEAPADLREAGGMLHSPDNKIVI